MTSLHGLKRELFKMVDTDNALALLRGAVARESVTGNEANFVNYLQPKMEELGLDPARADFAPERPNIWGDRKGNAGGNRLLFMGHTDTVHVRGWKERWAGTERESPFGAASVDGEVWGRGAGDLKAGICSSLAALELLDRVGLRLRGDVAFAFVGDEESGEPGTGVSAGAKEYARRVAAGEISKPNFAVYVEPTRLAVCTAQMGFFIAEVKVTGKSAYFGVPEQGIDAIKAAHKALHAVWEHSDAISTRSEHELVGRAFVLVTHLEGGGYIAVPGECSFSLIRKLLPGEDLDAAVSELEAVLHNSVQGEGVEFEIGYPAGRDHRFGGSATEVDSEQTAVRMLSAAMAEVIPGCGRIEGAPYWSETPFLIKEIGCPAVYCAPGDITNCHTLEERVSVGEYIGAIVAFAMFMASYCGVSRQ